MTELRASEICDIVGGKLYGDGNAVVRSVSTDSRTVQADGLFVALKGERFDANDFLRDIDGKVAVAIAQRFEEVSYPLIVVDNTLDALTALSECYAKNRIAPKVKLCLTGSVGKTTTKEMTSAVLATMYKTAYTKGNLNNHIGVPLTLLSVESDDEALVCEMGMNHKGELYHLSGLVDTDIAMITNIGHSHIENLGSREGIRDAKLEILRGLKKDGTLILHGDEPLLENVEFEGRIIRVGLTDKCDLWAENILMSDESVSYTLHAFGKTYEIKLPCTGKHNVVNSLFAIAAGLTAGIGIESIAEGLLNYRSVGLRQNIYVKNGVRVIADCYNAGIESMTASIRMMSEMKCEGKRIAVLADMLELGEISEEAHRTIGRVAKECRIDAVLTTGKAAEYISLEAKSSATESKHYETKQALAEALKNTVVQGDTVLFKASNSMKLEEVIKLADLEK